jgi:tetratricopeptide (TPR) repeat protein
MSDIPSDPGEGPPTGPDRALDIPSLFAEAARLKSMGELDRSEDIYFHILQTAPNHPESFYELSHIHIEKDNLEVATKCLIAAIKIKPDFLQAHMTLGAIHRSGERGEEAEKCFREAIRLSPGHAEAHFLLGILLRDQNRLDESIECMKEAISLKPEYGEAHIQYGAVLRDSGDVSGAVEHYREAVRIDPDDVHSRLQLGATLHESGKFHEALDVFLAARFLEPELPEIYVGLGSTYTALRKHKESADSFRKAIDLKPDYLDAYYHLSNTYMGMGNIEEDEAILGRALERWPGEPQLKLILDMAYPAFPEFEEIDRRRREIAESLDRYDPETFNVSLKNLTTYARPPSFYMAYHGRDDLALKSKYADLFAGYFEKKFPGALWSEKKSASGAASGIRRIPRIGFLMTLHGPFMIWLKGLARKLSKEKFEVTIICPGHAQ